MKGRSCVSLLVVACLAVLVSGSTLAADGQTGTQVATYGGRWIESRVGISGTNNLSDVTKVPAGFDVLTLETDFPSHAVAYWDDFSEATLDPSWRWVNEDPQLWSLSDRPGHLRMTVHLGWVGEKNVLLWNPPPGDFTMDTRVEFQPSSNFQIAGLVLFEDTQNYLLLGRAYCDTPPPKCVGNGIYFDRVEGGDLVGSNFATATTEQGQAHLRVVREGAAYAGYYSDDGNEWRLIGQHNPGSTLQLSGIGITTGQDLGGVNLHADFDWVYINYAPVPVRSGWLQHAVTLDGVITDAAEWAEATAVEMPLWAWHLGPQRITGRWWLQNDNQWLYLLCRVPWPGDDLAANDASYIDFFWPPGSCCPWEHSDMGFVRYDGQAGDLHGWNESQWLADLDSGGTNDVEGAASYDGTYYWFEYRKRLNCGDGFDWAWNPGQTVGTGLTGDLLLGYWDASGFTVYEQYVTIGLSSPPAATRVFLPVLLKQFAGPWSTPIPTATPTLMPTATPTLPPQPADVIFHNGSLLTMEGSDWGAEAIAIRDEMIQAVGQDAQVLALQGPQTQLIDLQGHALMPGFVDPHTHVFNDAWRMELDLAGAQELALENGVTTLANMYVPPHFLQEMQDFESAGKLRVRTGLYLLYTNNCGEPQGDWWTAYPPTHEPGEMLRITGVKLFTDGGTCGCPAYSYDDPRCGYGDLFFTQQELNAALDEIQATGYQAALHAIGDRAIEQVLNAIEYALDGRPNTLRHRIEHNAVLRDDMLTRYTEVDPVAVVFTVFPACEQYHVPPEPYQPWHWRWPELIDANPGLHVSWHSDTPWIGPPEAPLLHLYSMVTPYEVGYDGQTVCDTPAWLAHKMLTVEQALPMMTTEAAYALFREQEVGSLKAGKFADVIILSDSPLAVDPEQIKDIEVWMTMIGGQVEYCASGQESFCPGVALP